MAINSLDKIFKPERIALIGVSNNPRSVGGIILTNLVGHGRLVADTDQESAEYAILITDSWQNKYLGNILTQYCLKIAKEMRLKSVFAETTMDNKAMISIFRKFQFLINTNPDSTVSVSIDLCSE